MEKNINKSIYLNHFAAQQKLDTTLEINYTSIKLKKKKKYMLAIITIRKIPHFSFKRLQLDVNYNWRGNSPSEKLVNKSETQFWLLNWWVTMPLITVYLLTVDTGFEAKAQ